MHLRRELIKTGNLKRAAGSEEAVSRLILQIFIPHLSIPLFPDIQEKILFDRKNIKEFSDCFSTRRKNA
jgi:hypothetical protein